MAGKGRYGRGSEGKERGRRGKENGWGRGGKQRKTAENRDF